MFFLAWNPSYEGEGMKHIQCQRDCSKPMVVNDKRFYAHVAKYLLCWQWFRILTINTFNPMICWKVKHWNRFMSTNIFIFFRIRRFLLEDSAKNDRVSLGTYKLKTPLAWGMCALTLSHYQGGSPIQKNITVKNTTSKLHLPPRIWQQKHLKICRAAKGNHRVPIINFQGLW